MKNDVRTLVEAAKNVLIWCRPDGNVRAKKSLDDLRDAILLFEVSGEPDITKLHTPEEHAAETSRLYTEALRVSETSRVHTDTTKTEEIVIEVVGTGTDEKPCGFIFQASDLHPNYATMTSLQLTKLAVDVARTLVQGGEIDAQDLSSRSVIHGGIPMQGGVMPNKQPLTKNELKARKLTYQPPPGAVYHGRKMTTGLPSEPFPLKINLDTHTPTEFPFGRRKEARDDLPITEGYHVFQCQVCGHEFEIGPGVIVGPCLQVVFESSERPLNPLTECGGDHQRIR